METLFGTELDRGLTLFVSWKSRFYLEEDVHRVSAELGEVRG